MEESVQKPENLSFGDYWPSAGIVGAIFGVITFAIGLVFGYYQIASEPTGSMFSPMVFSGVVVCLIIAVAGALAVWHFAKEVTPYMKLSQGAVIGFLTGAAIVITSALLNEIWHLIDPDYTEKLLEAAVANFEAMDLPADTKDAMIDSTADSIRSGSSLGAQILYGIPMYGILNLISGMIGAKIFGQKKEDETF